MSGGAVGSRTPDPHNAIVVLYQLSYDPTQRGVVFMVHAKPLVKRKMRFWGNFYETNARGVFMKLGQIS